MALSGHTEILILPHEMRLLSGLWRNCGKIMAFFGHTGPTSFFGPWTLFGHGIVAKLWQNYGKSLSKSGTCWSLGVGDPLPTVGLEGGPGVCAHSCWGAGFGRLPCLGSLGCALRGGVWLHGDGSWPRWGCRAMGLHSCGMRSH